ncbi:MAG: GNAT family N-acetyltransferase [Candidatus Limnocylindrales bacterium]
MQDVEIRRVRPSDREGLSLFYATLSAESRRQRFLGSVPGVPNERARTFCAPDHMHEEGFVALTNGDAPRIIGHLCLGDAGGGSGEIGIAVANAVQGLGIGRLLFEAALAWARERNVDQLVASTFADNTRLLRLLTSARYSAQVGEQGCGIVELTIPLRSPLPRSTSVPITDFEKGQVASRLRAPRSGRHVYWLRRPGNKASASIGKRARARPGNN